MKTKKKPGEKARFLLRPFSIVFPGCYSIRQAVEHRPARGRQCRSQLAKSQCSFCKGVSACSCGAPNSQKHIRSLQKYVCMLLCFTGTLLATYRLPVPENGCRDFCPCWGVGRSPARSLAWHKESDILSGCRFCYWCQTLAEDLPLNSLPIITKLSVSTVLSFLPKLMPA